MDFIKCDYRIAPSELVAQFPLRPHFRNSVQTYHLSLHFCVDSFCVSTFLLSK